MPLAPVGRFRKLVKIEKPTQIETDEGEFEDGWVQHASVRVWFVPKSGREIETEDRIAAAQQRDLQCQFVDDVDTTMRINHHEKILNIISVVDVDDLGRQLLMRCSEVT